MIKQNSRIEEIREKGLKNIHNDKKDRIEEIWEKIKGY